jgi:poly-gamma-glutamate capsule biosynthesis protein CapA/YwtB (metallophosphatase superfamily)
MSEDDEPEVLELMSYSRSRTHEKNRSRRNSRVRYLLIFNLVLFVLAAGAVALLFRDNLFGGGRQKAPAPSGGSEAAVSLSPSQPASPSHQTSPSPSGAGSTGETQPSEEVPNEPAGKIKLAFVGDILPAANVVRLMKKFGYDYPFREAAALLQSADITAGNLESSITVRGTPAQNKQFLFRGPVDALPAIREAGFDVLSLANNHTLDYGWVGLQDTMDALDDHKLRHMGAGIDDKQAYSPVYVESQGLTVAYVGVSQVLPEVSWKAGRAHPGLAEAYDHARAVAAIEEAGNQADLVVVMVHWGKEKADKATQSQTNLGRRFIDAGADLVIGSHPHVLQGFESYKDKWIAYSLGNFVFNMTATPKTAETGVLMAECGKDGSCSLDFHPMLAKESQPAPMEEAAGKALWDRLSDVSTAASFGENGNLVAKR